MTNDRLKKMLGMLSLLCLMALFLWLPTRFIPEGAKTDTLGPQNPAQTRAPSAPMSRGERAALVSACRVSIGNKSPAPNGFVIEDFDESALPEEINFSLESNITILMSLLLLDAVEDSRETGSGRDCYIFTNEKGQSVSVWRYFLEWTGDWKNWVELYADIDTGEIYYFYFSAGCERNAKLYESDGRITNAEEFARMWQDFTGHNLESFDWNGRPESAATAVYSNEGEPVTFSVECRFYKSALADYRIIMQE